MLQVVGMLTRVLHEQKLIERQPEPDSLFIGACGT
jgi:hypothetical protein